MTSVKKHNKIDSFFSRIFTKEKQVTKICSFKTELMAYKKSIIIECRDCTNGTSSLDDLVCRHNIFQILIKEPRVDKLVLSHLYERDYEGESLDLLYMLAGFIDNLGIFKNVEIPAECGNCLIKRRNIVDNILEISLKDPVEGYLTLEKYIQSESENGLCINNSSNTNNTFIYSFG